MFKRLVRFLVLIGIVSLFIPACSGGDGGRTPATGINLGLVGGPCRQDGTCNEGLVCNVSTNLCSTPIPHLLSAHPTVIAVTDFFVALWKGYVFG